MISACSPIVMHNCDKITRRPCNLVWNEFFFLLRFYNRKVNGSIKAAAEGENNQRQPIKSPQIKSAINKR